MRRALTAMRGNRGAGGRQRGGRSRGGGRPSSGSQGGQGGRGQQRWWDPVWRAEKLAQKRDQRPAVSVDQQQLLGQFHRLQADSSQSEIIFHQNFGRQGCEQVLALADTSGLHGRTYNKGTDTVLVVSKVPLPNYRADLDPRAQTEHEVQMSGHLQQLIQGTLKDVPAAHADHGQQPGEPPPGLQAPAHGGTGKRAPAFRPDDARAGKACKQSGPVDAALAQARKRLPAFTKRQELLDTISSSQVTVISGATGCGKTTQLPQFLLEQAAESEQACNIIITQPRRISAISVAQRVAEERGEALGQSVGYQIRAEGRRSAETRLLFCTTGVLLRRLINDPLLHDVTHVVVDEIHERGMSEDFLLIVLRDMLSQRPDLRLVLMSATLNARAFASYFGGCPLAEIPGFTHPVQNLFLEDVLRQTGLQIQQQQQSQRGFQRWQGQQKSQEAPEFAVGEQDMLQHGPGVGRSIANWAANTDRLDLDLIAGVVTHICRTQRPGAILVFVTGWDEIQKLHDLLSGASALGPALVLPLHSSMPTTQQRLIFDRPPAGTRKIVLATSIAETSITIDDVVHVVDCGKVKLQAYDALNKLAVLAPVWISQAAATQRSGRAGRVQPGVCYRLYPQRMHEQHFEAYQAPELLRVPLEGLCLQVKSLQLGAVQAFLGKAMDAPDPLAVSNALELLRDIGALDQREQLTPLGRHLAELPADPCIGKLVLMGAVFGCLEPVLIIAAALSHRDPFLLPLDRKEEADRARLTFAGESRSDHIALLRAFQGWTQTKQQGGAWQFCRQNFLSNQTLQAIDDIRLQLGELVVTAGFLGPGRDAGSMSKPALQSLIAQHSPHRGEDLLRAVLCAGMFPAVAAVRQAKRPSFTTREDGKVEPHLTSVLGRESFFPHRWLVYSDKVKTASIYLRAATMASDYALLLFGGPLARGDSPGTLTLLQGHLTFTAPPHVADLLLQLRAQLDGIFARHLAAPDGHASRDAEADKIVQAVVQLLREEPAAHEEWQRSRGGHGRSWGGHRGRRY